MHEVAPVDIRIDRNSVIPAYRQVYQQIRHQIAAGSIPAGALIPKIRDLAASLGVARNTVEAAYRQLSLEGYAHGKRGIGYVVEDLDFSVVEAQLPEQDAAPASVHLPAHRKSPLGDSLGCRYDFSYGNRDYLRITHGPAEGVCRRGARRRGPHGGCHLHRPARPARPARLHRTKAQRDARDALPARAGHHAAGHAKCPAFHHFAVPARAAQHRHREPGLRRGAQGLPGTRLAHHRAARLPRRARLAARARGLRREARLSHALQPVPPRPHHAARHAPQGHRLGPTARRLPHRRRLLLRVPLWFRRHPVAALAVPGPRYLPGHDVEDPSPPPSA